MPYFKFKLQSVLDLKVQMEDNFKNELSTAMRKLKSEKEVLDTLIDKKESYVYKFNDVATQGMLVDRLKGYTSFISFLDEEETRQKYRVNVAENNADKCREKLITAAKEKEMLQKLKEKELEQYMKEQLKKEAKLNDEIISFKYKSSRSVEDAY